MPQEKIAELRIRYDESTTYPLPQPAITLNDGCFACDCAYCEASYLAAFASDGLELQRISQAWLDWVIGKRVDLATRLCGPAYLHLATWWREQSKTAS